MDKGKQTIEDRIKAYIYYGVEAEMEMIEAQFNVKQADDDSDRNYWRKRMDIASEQIVLANKRITDLENRIYP